MALACGRYNARSDRLRVRSERSLCSRNAHGPITDDANLEEPGSGKFKRIEMMNADYKQKEKVNLIPNS